MASIIPIVMAVRRHQQYQQVQAELQEARQERQQAAEERRLMQETLQAHMAQSTNSNPSGYDYQGYGYPEAEAAPASMFYMPDRVQPLGVPVQGVPVQNPSSPVYATTNTAVPPQTVNATLVVAGPNVQYCDHCERYHELPMCPLTRRERRQERREERRERREDRREERRERRDARRNRS